MNSNSAITEFLDGISWGDNCLLQTDSNLDPYLLLEKYILVPCHWQRFEQKRDQISALAKQWNLKPGCIIYGHCPDYDCARLNYQLSRQGFVIYWLGAREQLNHSGFLLNTLDGIDFINLAFKNA